MTVSKLITLKEIFPLHHEKIGEMLVSNGDLRSIVEDLLECHQFLTSASAEHTDGHVPREFWEELFEDLRNEAIELVARETS